MQITGTQPSNFYMLANSPEEQASGFALRWTPFALPLLAKGLGEHAVYGCLATRACWIDGRGGYS